MSEENPNDVSFAQQEIDEKSKIQFEEADFKKAQEYLEKESILDRSSDKPKQFSMNCDLNDFKRYGIGLYFYFDILKKTAIFFFVASLICIPTLYSNCSGGGLGSSSNGISGISKCSLANQPTLSLEIPASSATQTEINAVKIRNDARIAAFTDDMNYRKDYVWIPDLIYSILFLFFLMYFKLHSKIHKKKQTKIIQPSKYTIQMLGFPENTTDTNKIKKFMTKVYNKEYPPTQENPQPLVMEVSFAKDFNNTLFLHKAEAKLMQQIVIEKKKMELQEKKKQNEENEGNKIQTKKELKKSVKLQEKEEKLKKIQDQVNKKVNKKVGEILNYQSYPSLSAFIIFNTFEQKEQMIKIFQKYSRRHWIFRYILCCFRRQTEKEIKFKKIYTPIIIGDVDQPSNIKWENLDIKLPNRLFRGLIIFVVVLAVMLLTLAVLIAANTVKPANPASCPSNAYTYMQSVSSSDSEVKRCYCLSLSTSELLDNSVIKNYCWDIYIDNVKTQVLTILTTLAIVISNMILAVILKKVTKYLRYKTVSSETTTSAILLFLCTFINTAILTLLLQGDIYGFAPAVVFTSPVPPLYDIQADRRGSFSTDFDRSWYTSVGQKLVLTMIISTVWPHIVDLVLIPVSKYIRIRRAKSKVIQHEMNKLVVGPEFNLQQHYTSFLNMVFVCLFYSSGQPLLIPAGFVALLTQYWIFKYRILRWHRKPIAFNGMLNSAIQKVLPWSLILHLSIGIYMYGQPLIFPRNSAQLSAVISSSLNSAGVYTVVLTANQTAPIADRAYSSIVLFILLIIVIIFYIFDIAFSKAAMFFLSKLLRCFIKTPSSNQVMPIPPNEQLTYSYQYKKMGQLASYDIRLNENYSHLIEAIDMGSQINSNCNTPKSTQRNNTKENLPPGQIVRPSQFQTSNINNGNNNNNPSFEVLNGQNLDAIVPETLQKSPETEILCQP